MANEKTQQPGADAPGLNGTSKQVQARVVPAAAPTNKPDMATKKRRDKAKNNMPRIGGTAVPGAKSTQPKQVTPTNNPNQQQSESSNRTMRRRMEQMGTGPESENERGKTIQERRKKQIDRRKERLEEKRAELRKSLPGGKLTLGRTNTYFVIAVSVLIVLLIITFALLRYYFHVI